MNNPVLHRDSTGNTPETVWDVISLGLSVADVIANPYDPWAWAGLAGDVVDVAIPFVGGVGEAIKVAKVVNTVGDTADSIHDASKVARGIDELTDVSINTARTTKNLRSSAVRQAWKNEVILVQNTGKGTRVWTDLEIEELLTNGKVKGYVGHHMKSPQCKMEVNRKNRTLTHFIYLLRKIAEQQPFSTIITSIRTLYKTRFFKRNGGEKADNHKSNRCKKPYISRVFGVCYPMSQADFESAEQI